MSAKDVREQALNRPTPTGATASRPPSGTIPVYGPPSIEEFFDLLDRSQLVPSKQLESMRTRVLAEGQMSAREFAQSLAESGHLTRWQADRLLARKAGFQLGKYRLVDRIGAGGMAVVLKGQQTGLKRNVAIKVLARTLLQRKEAVKRFFREIEAASALEHENIVRAIDSDCIDGVPFLVMEYIEGRDLNSIIAQRGALSIPWACEFCRQVAQGLQHAFERDVVHRDVKPANLLVTRRSPADPLLVKILDFGLAKFASDVPDVGSLTAAHQIFGTVDFISPEQARSARSADTRSDIFSLGCTLFFLLTGKPPFRGETALEKLTARITDGPIPLRELRPEVPPELDAVVMKMLARDPVDRYQTPAEVVHALAPFSASLADASDPIALARRPDDKGTSTGAHESEIALEKFLGQLSHFPETKPPSGESIPIRRRRNPALLVTLTLLAALLATAAVLAARPFPRKKVEHPAPPPVVKTDAGETEELAPQREAAWPGEPAGQLVAWHAGLGTKLTGTPNALVWGLEMLGGAEFGGDGALRLSKGGVVVHGPEQSIASRCGESGEFTLEIRLNTESSNVSAPRRIVTLKSAKGPSGFTFAQSKDHFVARVDTTLTEQGKSAGDVELCRTSPGTSRHLIITYRDGQLLCYVDGEKVSERDDIRGALSGWDKLRLHLGPEPKEGRSWSGSIDRLALFSRFFTLDDARARFQLSESLKRKESTE